MGLALSIPVRRRLWRAGAVALFGAGLAASASQVIGRRFDPVLLVPTAIVVVAGLLAARLRWWHRIVVAVAAVAGSLFAVTGIVGGRPSDVYRGVVDGARQVLTTAWPSPGWPSVLVALAAVIAVACALAVEAAMRRRWRALPLLPLVVALAMCAAASAPAGPQWGAVAAATAASFVLLLVGVDERVVGTRSSVPSALFVGGCVALAALTLTFSDRADPRSPQPARSALTVADPLAELVAERRVDPPTDLYEVASPKLSELPRWRTAVLDQYDGERWNSSAELLPSGHRLAAANGRVRAKITALQPSDVLWPIPGRVDSASTSVETDLERDMLRIVADRRPTSITLTIAPFAALDPSSGLLADHQPSDVEAGFKTLAQSLAGSGTVSEQVESIAERLRARYSLDPQASGGGLQLGLVERFLRDTRRGNAEQFVTGFVLLSRSLGIDARVAIGYQLNGVSGTAATLTSADAAAWAEVELPDGSWVAVDVVPDTEVAVDVPEPVTARPETPPAVQPPPQGEVAQADQNDPVDLPTATARVDVWAEVRRWGTRAGVTAGLLLWPVVVFAAVVSVLKIRRRRGLSSSDPARRVTTAWLLATDALVDAGATLEVSDTNAELVAAGAQVQPGVNEPLSRLQRHADSVSFATAACPPDRAVDAVEQLRAIEHSIARSSSRWWRLKWWLSTRSLRRGTRSPVRAAFEKLPDSAR